MPVSTTWSVTNMTHKDADGGVILVYWQCVAQNDSGPETAVEAGKLRCEPDPTSPGFIPYDNLTEDDVLGWVYDSLVEGEETPEEAKARISADRVAKVDAQIARNASQSEGMPWAPADADLEPPA
jgi:hypothetical protein